MRAFSQGPYSKSSLTAGSSLHNDVSLLKKKKKEGVVVVVVLMVNILRPTF